MFRFDPLSPPPTPSGIAKIVSDDFPLLHGLQQTFLLTDGLEDDVQEAVKQFAQRDHSQDQRRHERSSLKEVSVTYQGGIGALIQGITSLFTCSQ